MTLTKAEDYQTIGVAEVWIYCREQLLIYCFNGEQYWECQTSQQFRDRNVKTLIQEYVNKGWQVGSSVALREFEQFLREGS